MKTEESLSKGIIKRIIFIVLVLLIILGICVFAGNQSVNSIVVKFSDGTELTVITSKTNVNDILKENNIYVLDDEIVTPNFDENIDVSKTITILRKDDVKEKSSESVQIIETEEIAETQNGLITEKLIKETEEIPFETITKEVSAGESGEKVTRVVQEGKNGIKEITYKVQYNNDVMIEGSKVKVSEQIIQEPVNKIVNVVVKVSSRSESVPRNVQVATSGSKADYQAYAKSRCAAYGWSDDDFNCLVALWNRESGWNPSSRNRSSGAYGIPQALPASKMASAGSDYLTNANTQINWGLSYIKGRYGSPSAAYQHQQRTGWY